VTAGIDLTHFIRSGDNILLGQRTAEPCSLVWCLIAQPSHGDHRRREDLERAAATVE
jgi:hypothetical protein